MIKVIPKYKIEVELDTDLPNIRLYCIYAYSMMEATDWFNKLSFGLNPITKLTIEIDKTLENSTKGSFHQ